MNTQYDATVSTPPAWLKDKLDGIISKGRSEAEGVLSKLEAWAPRDRVAGARALDFSVNDDRTGINVSMGDSEEGVHRHAMVQIAERAGMPSATKTTQWLSDPEVIEHLPGILNSKYRAMDKKFLVRSVDDQVRGFLSDRYRRLDSRPMVAATLQEAMTKYGAVPSYTKLTDTQFTMKMVMPTVFEMKPGEFGLFGICFRNSDFGNGRLFLKGFFLRPWCSNGAMAEDGIAQVHLGRQLSEDITFSDRTYQLDTSTMASALRDVTSHVLAPANVNKRIGLIRAAAENEIDAKAKIKALRSKSRLTKSEADRVTELFNSADVQNMPAGNTDWRLSNAVSWMAHEQNSVARQTELEDLAGRLAGLHLKAA